MDKSMDKLKIKVGILDVCMFVLRESEVTRDILEILEMMVILEMLVTLVLQDRLENLAPKDQVERKVFLDLMGNLGPEEFQDLAGQEETQGTLEEM